jgi:hypothetical protein
LEEEGQHRDRDTIAKVRDELRDLPESVAEGLPTPVLAAGVLVIGEVLLLQVTTRELDGREVGEVPPHPSSSCASHRVSLERASPDVIASIASPLHCAMGLQPGTPMVASGTYERLPPGHEVWIVVFSPNGDYYP